MKLNMLPLLLLPLLISACDSEQPSYSASNATSAPAPAPVAPEAPPPPPAPAVPEKHVDAAPPPAAALPRVSARSHPTMASRPETLPVVKTIGIGSCDSYIERYRACVNSGVANGTMPNPSKFALMHSFNRQVRQWQADVAAGNTKELVTACADAEKKVRDELVKAGCTSF